MLTAVATDRVFRIPAIRLAEAGLGTRPTYMYLFAWETPVFGGKLKSCHALELPFMWDAIDKPGLSVLTGDGPERQALADVMHAAWISFARTGDPGWPAYDTDRRATQVFDTDLRGRRGPDGRATRALVRRGVSGSVFSTWIHTSPAVADLVRHRVPAEP